MKEGLKKSMSTYFKSLPPFFCSSDDYSFLEKNAQGDQEEENPVFMLQKFSPEIVQREKIE